MKKLSMALTVTILAGLLLSACATPTPVTIVETVEVPGPERTVIVEQTVVVPAPEKTVVEFWSTDHEEERIVVYEQVAADFMAEHPDIEVRVVPIDEGTITQRMSTALAANRLPDVIRHGVERISPALASGILDTDATTQVITDLGEDTFFEGPLEWVTDPATGNYAAVPFDGWIQAIWYRADAFEDLGLDAPVTWDAIQAGCEAIAGYEDFLYGMTIGTDPGWNYGHQIFEQVAMSNGLCPSMQRAT
jgi:multiple sugar transport system substrate-binding protein